MSAPLYTLRAYDADGAVVDVSFTPWRENRGAIAHAMADFDDRVTDVAVVDARRHLVEVWTVA